MAYGIVEASDDTIEIEEIEVCIENTEEDLENTEDPTERESLGAEITSLKELREMVKGHEGPLINEDYFETHAEDFYRRLIAVDFNDSPFNRIDWAEVAEDLSAGYTCFEWQGSTFLARS